MSKKKKAAAEGYIALRPNKRLGVHSLWPLLRWPSLAGFGWPLRVRVLDSVEVLPFRCFRLEKFAQSGAVH